MVVIIAARSRPRRTLTEVYEVGWKFALDEGLLIFLHAYAMTVTSVIDVIVCQRL
jgi:hypothetical protein